MPQANVVTTTSPVNAAETARPKLARRAFLSAAALALPAVALIPSIAVASPDAELVALAEQVVNLRFQSEEADEEYARRADVASGCRATEEVCDALYARIDELFEQMLDITPSTLEGYRAMASAVVNCCWSGAIFEMETGDQRMIAAMFSSLTGVPINAAA